ncbi:hypothetical protein MHBO_004145 [Bonamia ostreae]|uniref:Uncharacterized protein n=1 Tax=Bonamia ostreae TaxID=126728 RepID=A0ABV2ATA9_9EUKA
MLSVLTKMFAEERGSWRTLHEENVGKYGRGYVVLWMTSFLPLEKSNSSSIEIRTRKQSQVKCISSSRLITYLVSKCETGYNWTINTKAFYAV